MSHKALIDGTAYKIKGGSTLIDGTVHNIKKGRTLIDGTGYDINFAKAPYEGLIHEWLFEGNLDDSVGGLPLEIYHYYHHNQNPTLKFERGVIGQCLTTHYDNQLRVGQNIFPGAQDVTFSFWFKHTSRVPAANGERQYINFTYNNYLWVVTISQVTNGGTYMLVFKVGQSNSYIISHNIADFDNWMHFVITVRYVGSALIVRLYLNGVLVYETQDFNTYYINYFDIASMDNICKYDQYRIYNRILSDAEISALYNNGQGV